MMNAALYAAVGQIDTDGADLDSGLFVLSFDDFAQTLGESRITDAVEIGGGVRVTRAIRNNRPHWFIDNPLGGWAVLAESEAA